MPYTLDRFRPRLGSAAWGSSFLGIAGKATGDALEELLALIIT